MRVLKIASAVLLLSAPVFAQDDNARRQATEIAARVPFERAMKGAPYSAESVVESSQTLPDGNRISRKTTGFVFRDGEGRTRREEDVNVRTATPNGAVSSVRTTISIVDPIGGFSYSLDPDQKIAWRTPVGGANAILRKVEASQVAAELDALKAKLMLEEKLKAAQGEKVEEVRERSAAPTARAGGAGGGGGTGGGGRGGAVAAVGVGGGGVMVARGGGGGRGGAMAPTTPLEHKTIEGVAVEGRKTITVIPAGQVGNEQPITITSEEWRSPELDLLVLTKHADPRSGESSYRLQNIIRAEPDRSLFMVPADYEVKDTGIRRMLEASIKK